MRGYTCRFKYNPIPLSKEWMLTALLLYDDNDDMWETDKIKNYIVAYQTKFEDEEWYSFSRNDSKQSSDDSNESESESSSNSRGSEHNLENNDGELIASDPDNLTHLS